MNLLRLAIAGLILVGIACAVWLPGHDGVLGSYATSLQGRTRGQRINAHKAAQALDGVVIEPGAAVSFNRIVGSWTPERGYVLAPVSYDGELVVDWGGGVCQTSSTLYNAALLAGLDILERHRHTWAPKYVPPGQDAAVAQTTIDLRLRNPYPWPISIHTRTTDDSIGFEIVGRQSGPIALVSGIITANTPPLEIIKNDPNLPPHRRYLITRGRPGLRVAVYRTFATGPRTGQHLLVSQDTYPVMNRVIAVGD